MLTKEEMLEFCKNGLIPASHIMIHDNENIHLACSLFKVSLRSNKLGHMETVGGTSTSM